ncbi:MAG: sulfite exporter TauE/SafE family protein [Candidatus Rokuibacteriota bacterium]|nr:MAG: sulfite exporter TauE/SafE family protein [Candidatus Rokubacteria bacterium]PYO00535.1 MAG: sulfite exporter TauE/SafE family protein [Candidatus Rokubacteria bacterium]
MAGRQAASPAVTAGVRDMTLAFAATLMGLGLGGAFVAGLLGVGGAIIMIPLLLYVPPLVDVGKLSVKAVAGVTMVQVLVAATSGMLAHRRHRAVNAELAWVGGVAMASGSLVGALGSYYVYDRWLLLIFALMVTAAGALMIVPVEAAAPSLPIGEPRRFSRPLTATVCGSVGVGAGLVGAGGAFLLVPLLLVVVGVPIRVTIGSSLAITALSSSMGVVGKLVTDQIPYESALVVAIGAVPGAQLGAALSRRLSGSQLKLALGLIIVVIAVRVWWDVLTYH